MTIWRRLAEFVAWDGAAILVSVHAVRGSAPRGPGARLAMRPDGGFHGTIGGGRLEWEAFGEARRALVAGRGPARFVEQALGPDLGQCCGGLVTLLIEMFSQVDAALLERLATLAESGEDEVICQLDDEGRVRREPSGEAGHGGKATWRERLGEAATPLLLFGAGHVGRALVLALAPLPFAVRWLDSRSDAFPDHVPSNARPERLGDPARAIETAPAGALVLVMTHDHALDLALVAAALGRGDLGAVGLIGSATKRARFERRLRQAGISPSRIADLVCPIGIEGIEGKEPAVIAASVAAQMLHERSRLGRTLAAPQIQREAS